MFFIIKKNHPGFLFVYFGKNDFMSTKTGQYSSNSERSYLVTPGPP